MIFTPSYISLFHSGELASRAEQLDVYLDACSICPHKCLIDRRRGAIARCHSGFLPVVSSYCKHFGEEPGLGGTAGVGNIFFGNCNLRCMYCQNHQISQNWRAENTNMVSCERLAEMMLELQTQGCRAIGFVSPTHFSPQIVRSIAIAAGNGLILPLIFNSNGYDSAEILRLLEGIIDIFLPDLKYAEELYAYKYSKISNYPVFARTAVKEMYRQVGPTLSKDRDGNINRGLIIRHLVLPNNLASSKETLRWIRDELDPSVTVSIMSQYYPAAQSARVELLDRRIRESEYEKVLMLLETFGLQNGWIQNFESQDFYRPDFQNRAAPFAASKSADVRPRQ